MNTPHLDKLYLELSQVTTAQSDRELRVRNALVSAIGISNELIEALKKKPDYRKVRRLAHELHGRLNKGGFTF